MAVALYAQQIFSLSVSLSFFFFFSLAFLLFLTDIMLSGLSIGRSARSGAAQKPLGTFSTRSHCARRGIVSAGLRPMRALVCPSSVHCAACHMRGANRPLKERFQMLKKKCHGNNNNSNNNASFKTVCASVSVTAANSPAKRL